VIADAVASTGATLNPLSRSDLATQPINLRGFNAVVELLSQQSLTRQTAFPHTNPLPKIEGIHCDDALVAWLASRNDHREEDSVDSGVVVGARHGDEQDCSSYGEVIDDAIEVAFGALMYVPIR
jgi:hypothetical protein